MKTDYISLAKLIAAKNHIDISSIKKFDSGEVNKVFNINNKFVIKIEGEPEVATNLLKRQPEKIEMLYQKGGRVPKILDYGQMDGKEYLLMEKIEGINLSADWWSFNDLQKENLIEQIAEQLIIFHSIKSDLYFNNSSNFKEAVSKEPNFAEINKTTLKPKYKKLIETLEIFFESKLELLNEENTAVFNHNDLHFENIIYKDASITGIIDFDYFTYAPIDYELRKLIDFAHTPSNYLSRKLGLKYKNQQLTVEIKMLRKHYPSLFQHQNQIDRIKLYLIEELLWAVSGYQKGKWSEKAMILVEKKIHDWYETDWLDSVLN